MKNIWIIVGIVLTMALAAASGKLGFSSQIENGTSIQTQISEDPIIEFINGTKEYLIFYVDNERVAAAPAGDKTWVFAKVGTHTLTARASDGRSVSRTIELKENGATWTIVDGN